MPTVFAVSAGAALIAAMPVFAALAEDARRHVSKPGSYLRAPQRIGAESGVETDAAAGAQGVVGVVGAVGRSAPAGVAAPDGESDYGFSPSKSRAAESAAQSAAATPPRWPVRWPNK